MRYRPFAALVLCASLTAPLHADVSLKAKMRSGGFKGMGAFSGASEEMVQGIKSRSKSAVKYQSALMRMAAGGDRDEIIRVDLDKVWTINAKKKNYTERAITLPPIKETVPDKTDKKETPAAEEKPTHRLKKAEFTVKNTGEKKEINGFKTTRYAADAVVEVEEIATKEVTSYLMNTNIWTTPMTKTLKQAGEEQAKFAKAYAAKLGLANALERNKRFDASSVSMMLGVGGAKTNETLESLRKKIDTIEGYPVATESVWTLQEDPRAVARQQEAKEKAKQQAVSDESDVDTAGGAKGIAGSLMGNFAKKKMRERQEKADAKRAAEPMLSTYYEVESITVDPVDAAAFEEPAGFKKILTPR